MKYLHRHTFPKRKETLRGCLCPFNFYTEFKRQQVLQESNWPVELYQYKISHSSLWHWECNNGWAVHIFLPPKMKGWVLLLRPDLYFQVDSSSWFWVLCSFLLPISSSLFLANLSKTNWWCALEDNCIFIRHHDFWTSLSPTQFQCSGKINGHFPKAMLQQPREPSDEGKAAYGVIHQSSHFMPP